MIVASLVAVGCFVIPARRRENSGGGSLALSLFFAITALVANAAYANIRFSDVHYRTHILSHVWASMAIAFLIGALASRFVAYAIAITFVFFGTWGAIERQDLYLGTWRRHQQELASIVNAAPALRPGTALILRRTEHSRFVATEAGYLAKCWTRLLYDMPELPIHLVAPDRDSTCQATASGLDCVPEGRTRHVQFRSEDIVVMDYDDATNTFHVVESLYNPEARIIHRPWTTRQKRLLLTSSSIPATDPRR
jgi:hypothetical protein